MFDADTLERVVRLMANAAGDRLHHSPDDYHMDHEMTSKVVRGLVRGPIPNFLHGRWEDSPLDHIPHLYYCDPLEGKNLFGRQILPTFWTEVTAQIPEKERMLACHKSQRDWLIRHHGVDDYLRAMRDWGAAQGKAAGVGAAEGFRQHLGHSYPQDNLLSRLLGGIDAPR